MSEPKDPTLVLMQEYLAAEKAARERKEAACRLHVSVSEETIRERDELREQLEAAKDRARESQREHDDRCESWYEEGAHAWTPCGCWASRAEVEPIVARVAELEAERDEQATDAYTDALRDAESKAEEAEAALAALRAGIETLADEIEKAHTPGLLEIERHMAAAVRALRDVPATTKPETCPSCRHAAHGSLGFCPNLASDNECTCTHKPAVPVPSEADREAGETYYLSHVWSGCEGSAWTTLPPATKDGWRHAEKERAEADRLRERMTALHRPDGGVAGPGAMCVECTPDFGTPAEDPVPWPCTTVCGVLADDRDTEKEADRG